MTANYVDSTGLVLQSLADIVTELETGFKTIYGSDINVDPNSPDGQMINLFAQSKIDILDCISQVYGSFSPTSAVGVALDQRCALNGVYRQGAVKTIVPVNITFDRQTFLVGEDDLSGLPFTVSNAGGDKFYLIDGFTGATGITGQPFRAAIAGAISCPSGSIGKIETITLGVTGVNNSLTPTTVGVDEETDASLRYRRALSTAQPSQGYIAGLKSAILALDNVTHCEVYENVTDAIDGNSITPHSIYVVVEGGTDADIADVIYRKRNAGCGMTGSTSVPVDIGNGFDLTVKFSDTTLQNLYITLALKSLDSDYVINSAEQILIKAYIADNVDYGINQIADYSAIAALVKNEYPLAVIVSGYLGTTGATGAAYMAPTTISSRWVADAARITLNVS